MRKTPDTIVRDCAARFAEGIVDEGYDIWAEARDSCESPIEEMMLAGLIFSLPRAGDICFPDIADFPPYKVDPRDMKRGAMIGQQVAVLGFRLDFLIAVAADGTRAWVGVECDGHEFHEKTKEQAARDKARDRAIASEGITVVRFTGSEIYKDAWACGREAWDICISKFAFARGQG